MPNPKKPSFEIDQQLLLNDSPEMVLLYAIRAIGSILDEQHEELAALRKEVEELKYNPFSKGTGGKIEKLTP